MKLLLLAVLLSGCAALKDYHDTRTHCTPDGRGGFYCEQPYIPVK